MDDHVLVDAFSSTADVSTSRAHGCDWLLSSSLATPLAEPLRRKAHQLLDGHRPRGAEVRRRRTGRAAAIMGPCRDRRSLTTRLQLAVGVHDHVHADGVRVCCSVGLEVFEVLEGLALATQFAEHVARSEHYELSRASQ